MKFLCNLSNEKLTKQWASHNRLRNLSKIEKKKQKKLQKNKRNVKFLNFSANFYFKK